MPSNSEQGYILEVKRLRTRSYRRQTGCVIVEGLPEVRRAIQSQTPIEQLFVCPEILETVDKQITDLNPIEVSRDVFAAMAFGSRLKGILAICKPHPLNLSDLKIQENACFVVLEGVEKPGNIGSVIRSADGAGIDAVFLSESATDLYNQHVVRGSIGTVFTIPVLETKNEWLLEFFKQRGIKVFAASAKAQSVYTDQDFTGSSAVVVGNEHHGVSEFWQQHCDEFIAIPMHGSASSLNVTVSASIFMYEMIRQRNLLNKSF